MLMERFQNVLGTFLKRFGKVLGHVYRMLMEYFQNVLGTFLNVVER